MSITAKSLENYQVEVTAGEHIFIIDDRNDGDNAGPSPYDYLLSSLAGCKVITAQMYAQRKGWPLERVEIKMSHQKVLAADCEDSVSDPRMKIDIIETKIAFQGELTEEQRIRLKQITERCPVHRTFTSETKLRTELVSALELV